MNKNNNIIIVPGEPKSVFFEIFFKAIKILNPKSPLILICNKELLIKETKRYKFKKKIYCINLNELKKKKIETGKIYSINIPFKKISDNHLNRIYLNDYIKTTFDVGLKLIKKKFSNKFLNGPINKEKFLKKKYLGVTEYITSKFKNCKTGMLIYNENLSVSPITTHLPIQLVSKKITKKILIQKIRIVENFFKKILKRNPRIGVTGLNPHCESILDFNEDNIISNTVKKLVEDNINIKGPYPADTVFLRENRKKFDVIIGMYHDQVLTPIKTLYEYDAINITMGLPFLRVSPDHGPNEKMVNKNVSNPTSLIKALEFLDQI